MTSYQKAIEKYEDIVKEVDILTAVIIYLLEVFCYSVTNMPYNFISQICLNRKTIQCNVLSQFQAADSVLVIGGGATGVEMAAEIRTEYPNKKVIIFVIKRH